MVVKTGEAAPIAGGPLVIGAPSQPRGTLMPISFDVSVSTLCSNSARPYLLGLKLAPVVAKTLVVLLNSPISTSPFCAAMMGSLMVATTSLK